MILQSNSRVELTKIHYYGRNAGTINTISREIFNKEHSRANVIIKNNIFGHRWVLKVNESPDAKKSSKIRVVLYILVFCCIVIAISFGIYFTIGEWNEWNCASANRIFQSPTSKRTRPCLEIARKIPIPTAATYTVKHRKSTPTRRRTAPKIENYRAENLCGCRQGGTFAADARLARTFAWNWTRLQSRNVRNLLTKRIRPAAGAYVSWILNFVNY